MPGAYKNFADLENNLTIDEIEMILEADREIKKAQQVFEAGLAGVDILKAEHEAKVKEVKRRAESRIFGEKNFAEMELTELGFTVETME